MAQLMVNVAPDPPLLRIEPFKGINLSVTPTQIDQSQASDMLNMNIDERGALNKRTGYERVFPDSLGEGAINGMFLYKKTDGTEIFLYAHRTKLYKTEVLPGKSYERLSIWKDDDLSKTWEGEV